MTTTAPNTSVTQLSVPSINWSDLTDSELDAFTNNVESFCTGSPSTATSDESGANSTSDGQSVDDGWNPDDFNPDDPSQKTDVMPLPYDAAQWPDHSHDGHIVDPATSPSDDDQVSCTD